MAFDKKPSTWIANWSEDGTNITIPIATFSELTAAEADATTGDIRHVLFAILEELWDTWDGTAAADRPGKLTLTKTASVDVSSGVTRNVYTYKFVIDTTVSAQEVQAEA